MDEKVIFIIVAGQYSIGFTTYGPFNSREEAKKWAFAAKRLEIIDEDDGWWVDTLLNPAETLTNHNM